MTVDQENPKESFYTRLEPKRKFSKVIEYKLNTILTALRVIVNLY